jgi:hypothetical protein
VIFLAAVSLAAICALLYLLDRAHRQIDTLLDRIQAPEVVVHRETAKDLENLEPVPVDLGPWATPPPPEDES